MSTAPLGLPARQVTRSLAGPVGRIVGRTLGRVLGRPGIRELLLLAGLYLFYSAARVVASDDVGGALTHATWVLDVEHLLHLDPEHVANDWLAGHRGLAVVASFYYAAAHYVVTPGVLLWLWLRRPERYAAARWALVAATVVALLTYIGLPTAPPRLYGGYQDVLAQTADVGWWSTSASAPQGLGGLTNELAAMPSMHVGWALWCALVLAVAARHRGVRLLGWVHLALTVAVVVGTGNHWLLDAAAGAALVRLAWAVLVTPRAPDYAPSTAAISAPRSTPLRESSSRRSAADSAATCGSTDSG